ncbi:pilin [Dyella jiangningensis]|jgi:pilus assembly protein Flp/PilA|uniref:Flp family type IVb pilin n=1 Tax=Dyella jiangningensis TaxID=1379159 RepID=UPI0004562AB0|nr:Flp family type IVb pilin [Dyella jiangningensis]AHX14989.1 pilin [Dyella jiangningensis]MDG2538435.1 Flp family type IVb pilin [Dyella jiangningensis]
MNSKIRNFLVDEDGITALEYGILAALVAAALVAVFGDRLQKFFTAVFNLLDTKAGVTST